MATSSNDKVFTKTFKIVEKSKSLLKYSGKNGEMTYFNCVGVNDQESSVLRIYINSKFSFIRPGFTYKFFNIIKKDDSYWVVSSSSVGVTSQLQQVVKTSVNLPEDEPEGGAVRTLKNAIESTRTSVVKGKVVQVSPLKKRRNQSLSVRALSLKDQSGVVKVCLFEEIAEQPFERNQIVQFTGMYKKVYNSTPQLTASLATKCEYIHDEDISNIIVTEEDMLVDDDFQEEADYSEASDCIINVIHDAVTYPCCSSEACRKKKLQNKKCIVCLTQYDKPSKGCRAIVEVEYEDKSAKVTIFNNLILQLFQLKEDELEDALILQLSEKLPVKFTAKVVDNRLYDVTVNAQ